MELWRRYNITLAGTLGAGKSTVAKSLEADGWHWVSSGELFRAAASKEGVDVVDLNGALKGLNNLDKEIDAATTALAVTPGHVFDSRMAWYFAAKKGCVPVFRVLLTCDPAVAANRIYSGSERASEHYSSYEECVTKLAERQQLERQRFIDIYDGLDYLNERNHDLVIDTTRITPDKVFERIIERLRLHESVDWKGIAIMPDVTKSDMLFDESFQMELDELNGSGKKNAKHSEEIHDEVELTRLAMAAFLSKELPRIGGNEWMKTCVEAAFAAYANNNPFAIAPSHGSISDYDLRSLSVIMEYNLDTLSFERNEVVRARDVREIVRIRNLYEHRDRQLNSRRWQNDVQALQVFRAKMKTDRELEDEAYELSQLTQMEVETGLYLDNLDSIQRQVEAISHSILDLGQSVHEHSENDVEQFEELKRQRDRDAIHDRAINDNTGDIRWLTERDRIQKIAIIGSIGIGVLNLGLIFGALKDR